MAAAASQKDVESPTSKKAGGKVDESAANPVEENKGVDFKKMFKERDKREKNILDLNVANYSQNAYVLNPDNDLKIGLDVCN